MIGLLSFYMKYYSGVYNMNVACFQKVVENDFLPNSISFEPNEEVRARQILAKVMSRAEEGKGWGGPSPPLKEVKILLFKLMID